jgi:hypothetical protein
MKPLQYVMRADPISFFGVETDPIASTIMSFTGLRPGWHYGRGTPASSQVATLALSARNSLELLGAEKFEAFPEVDGGILVSAYKDTICVDVLISHNFSINVVVENKDDEIFRKDGLSIDAMVDVVGANKWLSDKSSGSYILSTIATRKSDLNHWLLMSPVETKEYRLYLNVASPTTGAAYVTISGNIMSQRYPGTHLYSGGLPMTKYRHVA